MKRDSSDDDGKPQDDGVIDYAALMEPKKMRRKRYASLIIINVTAFMNIFSYSIILTSAKPYLDAVIPFSIPQLKFQKIKK